MPFDDVAAYENASPTLLAQQPVTPQSEPVAGKDWTTIFTHLEARLGQMRNWRWSWWAFWAELARFILPERYKWLVVANLYARGRPLNDDIVDSTATLAMKICAAGLWTGLTSPSRPWFKLSIGLPWMQLDPDGKAWLEDTQERVYTVLAQSNFYNVMAQAFRDVATFGTAPVIIYEDREDVIRLYGPCAGEYMLSVGSRLSVDTLYREFTLTVAQIVEMFTIKACPEQVRKLWEAGGASLENEFVVAHAIEPNFALPDKNGGSIRIVSGRYTFHEVYWLKGIMGERELSRRGFHERPFMVARWSVVSNDPYGRGPGMDAIGDTKQIQQETRRKAEFIEKGVRPPMGADPELKNAPASIMPAQITYFNTAGGQKKGFFPLFEVNPAWLAALVADIGTVAERIKECFYVPIFMAISQMEGVQPRNELELTKRDLERLQVLGPFISLFETEFASPAIQRVIQIMARKTVPGKKGPEPMLLPMPKSLRGVPLKIEFTSIMRLAQRSAEAVGLKDFAITGAAASEAAKASGVPDPLRIVNWDKWYRRYAEVTNTPSDIIFTVDEVQEHDQLRANAQKQAQMVGNATTAVAAAQALGNAKVTPDTALGSAMSAISPTKPFAPPGAGAPAQ